MKERRETALGLTSPYAPPLACNVLLENRSTARA
jgi:hypothetical protein